jgi:cysteine-rich repeat protein
MSKRVHSLARRALVGLAALFVCACGSDSTDPPGADASTTPDAEQLNCVLDGVKTDQEICDDGNQVAGDGCELDCSYTCLPGMDGRCDDGDPCTGQELCSEAHVCVPGTPAPDGMECGTGKVCKSGACADVTCGDMYVDVGEDCDDGNVDPDDGCDMCTFGCTADADCAPADTCAGAGDCDELAHTCLPLVPAADDTPCATGYCKMGVCTTPVCPNGDVEPGETCDDGNLMDGDGCDGDCTFSCVTPATDCPAAPACQVASCNMAHQCAVAADPTQNGNGCGGGNVCQNGACLPPASVCGNGMTESGEDCDFGAGNGANTGCETTCKFSCTKMPDSCVDSNTCNGVEACTNVTVGGKTGQKCMAGTPQPACTTCAGGFCGGGVCQASTCGDGCVDASKGEQCEPPSMGGCDAMCQNLPVCGNAVREAGEQCDDGNTTNTDGCSGVCKFEQAQRVNYLKMQFATDMFCTANRLGAAISGSTAQGQLQTALDDGVLDGSIDIGLPLLGLDDLSGTADGSLQVGFVNGTPETMGGTLMYNGASDLDWWHIADVTGLDANRLPTALLAASIAAKVLTGGPGKVVIAVILGGSPAALSMSSARVTVTIGAVSTPLTSMGNPPGHLAGEHLDPALQSFGTMGQQTANGAGKLCGNVSAASLAQVPIPDALVGGGLFACSQNYAATNSLLDVLVGGCTIFFTTQITSTQPDTVDASAPVAGAGGPYTLQANAQRVVSTCRDKNNAVVNLTTCLNAAAYSSFFKFATNRAIIK